MSRAVDLRGSFVSTTRHACSRRAPAGAASGPTVSLSAAPLSVSTPGLPTCFAIYFRINVYLNTCLQSSSVRAGSCGT